LVFSAYYQFRGWVEIPMKPAGDSGGSQQVIPVEESTLLHTEN